MPLISAYPPGQNLKVLLLGDSGSGKTGGTICSLAAAGYNVRVLDLEAKCHIVANMLLHPKSPYPAGSAGRVRVVTLKETRVNAGGDLRVTSAKVWSEAMKMLTKWTEPDGTDLGSISSWGENDVLVLDSFTALSSAALNWQMAMNKNLGGQPRGKEDIGPTQGLLRSFLDMFTSDAVKCNIVVIGHIRSLETEGEGVGKVKKGYTDSVGQALSPQVGRYFNDTLLAETIGVPPNLRRVIRTKTSTSIELKSSAPLSVADEYPVATGMADYFAAVLGRKPNG